MELIYHAKNYEGHLKDYEFSRVSMQEHWRAGEDETANTYVIEFATESLGELIEQVAILHRRRRGEVIFSI